MPTPQEISESNISPEKKYSYFFLEIQKEFQKKYPDFRAINYYRQQLAIIRSKAKNKASHEALNKIVQVNESERARAYRRRKPRVKK